jgi:Fe-Mn family superoxide dismutase
MYEAKTFNLPALDGISEQTIQSHLGLYAGYVKHVNKIQSELANINDDYARAEMQRRLGFEFGGMKNHEYYFSQFEGGTKDCPSGSFKTLVENQFGDFTAFIERMKTLAKTRGVGWVMCYHDHTNSSLTSILY